MVEPTCLDVKLGQGRNERHPGNVLYANIIAANADNFQQAASKDEICEKVITTLLNVGSRFMRKNEAGQWCAVDELPKLIDTVKQKFGDYIKPSGNGPSRMDPSEKETHEDYSQQAARMEAWRRAQGIPAVASIDTDSLSARAGPLVQRYDQLVANNSSLFVELNMERRRALVQRNRAMYYREENQKLQQEIARLEKAFQEMKPPDQARQEPAPYQAPSPCEMRNDRCDPPGRMLDLGESTHSDTLFQTSHRSDLQCKKLIKEQPGKTTENLFFRKQRVGTPGGSNDEETPEPTMLFQLESPTDGFSDDDNSPQETQDDLLSSIIEDFSGNDTTNEDLWRSARATSVSPDEYRPQEETESIGSWAPEMSASPPPPLSIDAVSGYKSPQSNHEVTPDGSKNSSLISVPEDNLPVQCRLDESPT